MIWFYYSFPYLHFFLSSPPNFFAGPLAPPGGPPRRKPGIDHKLDNWYMLPFLQRSLNTLQGKKEEGEQTGGLQTWPIGGDHWLCGAHWISLIWLDQTPTLPRWAVRTSIPLQPAAIRQSAQRPPDNSAGKPSIVRPPEGVGERGRQIKGRWRTVEGQREIIKSDPGVKWEVH